MYPFLFPNLFAVLGYRTAHVLGERGLAVIAHALCLAIAGLTGTEISWRAEIGPGLFIHHTVGVILPAGMRAGQNLSVGAGALVGSNPVADPSVFPTFDDDVQIMARASVIGQVHVGNGAVIGAHALVLRDVPPGATALGVPARNYLNGELIP